MNSTKTTDKRGKNSGIFTASGSLDIAKPTWAAPRFEKCYGRFWRPRRPHWHSQRWCKESKIGRAWLARGVTANNGDQWWPTAFGPIKSDLALSNPEYCRRAFCQRSLHSQTVV